MQAAAQSLSCMFSVIMAGGWGSRLAPFTSSEMGKQFKAITNPETTMIQETFRRLTGTDASKTFIDPSRILVSTNAGYVGLVQEQIPEIPEGNVIGEPMMRNTAPAIAMLMKHLVDRDLNAIAAVLPADHLIDSAEVFRSGWQRLHDSVHDRLVGRRRMGIYR